MAKETCSNCYVKLPGKVSFCPQCSRPTSHATAAELMDWDLRQWRQHVEHSMSSGGAMVGSSRTIAIDEAPRRTSVPVPTAPSVESAVASPRAKTDREPKPPKLARVRSWLTALRRLPRERDRVIVLDEDHAFVYRACTTCERSDWIVRYSRNEDRTYNYWCVRCSRSFKSDARLRHAMKPFVAAACVILPLVLLVRL